MKNEIKKRNNAGKQEIFDPVRKKWVKCTDEEMVRQCFVLYLITEKQIPASHISVEKEIMVNGLCKRYDIIVFDKEGKPWMVVECKAPHIAITQEVMEQAGRYNKTLRAPVIGITNGKEHRFFKIDFGSDIITVLV